MFKHLFILIFVLMLTVQAQLFDAIGGTLKNTNLGNTLGTENATASPADTSFLSYIPDPAISEQVLQAFIETLKSSGQIPPEQVSQVETAFRENLTRDNMQRFIDELFVGEGFKLDNLADVLTVYFIASFVVLNDLVDGTSTEQDLAVRNQVGSAFASVPEIQQLSNADKQKTAEGLILFTIFLANDWQQAQQGVEGYDLNTIKAYTRDTLLQMGIDPNQFDLTQQGLVRKSNLAQTTPTQPVQENPLDETQTAQNPLNPLQAVTDPFTGNFRGQNIALNLSGSGSYTGQLVFNGQTYPVQATSNGQNLTGTFSSSGNTFDFSATLAGTTLTLQSGGSTFILEKDPGN